MQGVAQTPELALLSSSRRAAQPETVEIRGESPHPESRPARECRVATPLRLPPSPNQIWWKPSDQRTITQLAAFKASSINWSKVFPGGIRWSHQTLCPFASSVAARSLAVGEILRCIAQEYLSLLITGCVANFMISSTLAGRLAQNERKSAQHWSSSPISRSFGAARKNFLIYTCAI